MEKTIKIHVEGGCVTEVEGIPEGYDYELLDADLRDENPPEDTKADEAEYPESKKFGDALARSAVISDFLDWLGSGEANSDILGESPIWLAVREIRLHEDMDEEGLDSDDPADFHDTGRLEPYHEQWEYLLRRYFGIDGKKLEEERRHMLGQLQEQAQKKYMDEQKAEDTKADEGDQMLTAIYLSDTGHVTRTQEDTPWVSTCLGGYVTATYAEVEAVFGKPNCQGDEYKVDIEWEISTPYSRATIYNYKDGPNYNGEEYGNYPKVNEDPEPRDWHIGVPSTIHRSDEPPLPDGMTEKEVGPKIVALIGTALGKETS